MPGSQAQPAATVDTGGDEAQPEISEQEQNAPAGSEPVEEAPPPEEPSVNAEPPAETEPVRDPQPVGLRQGLASLNSYHLKISAIANGPTEQDKNTSLYEVAYNSDGDRTYVHNESVSTSADDPEENRSASAQYQVGNTSCEISGSDGSADVSEMNPLQKELTNALANLIDMKVTAEDPVYVGEETVNGVLTDHYTFEVAKLGSESGAEVVANDGEYWVAKDGQYLVKYTVVMETRTAPDSSAQAEAMRLEFNIELSEINQPVEITLPTECE
jgi:hypothetical protein